MRAQALRLDRVDAGFRRMEASAASRPVAPNVLNRQFAAQRPNQKSTQSPNALFSNGSITPGCDVLGSKRRVRTSVHYLRMETALDFSLAISE